MAQDTVFYNRTERIFEQRQPALVMGILNVTPDSFHDGGKYLEEAEWLEQCGKMIREGAAIIDIGACSTRPGAEDVSEEEELLRLLKVIRSVRAHYPEILISADTFRSRVARQAIAAGADIINDISGGSIDEQMFPTVAELNVPYVLMHIQGTPQTMQNAPFYENVTTDVKNWFSERIKTLKALGFDKIILDPGFGFGKTLEHNYRLLRDLDEFSKMGYPLLCGFSRKSMINKLLNISSKDAVNGTTVLNTLALAKGASIIRVHDVRQASEAVRIFSFTITKGEAP